MVGFLSNFILLITKIIYVEVFFDVNFVFSILFCVLIYIYGNILGHLVGRLIGCYAVTLFMMTGIFIFLFLLSNMFQEQFLRYVSPILHK